MANDSSAASKTLVRYYEFHANENGSHAALCIRQDSRVVDTFFNFVSELQHEVGTKQGLSFVPADFRMSGATAVARRNENVSGACAMLAVDSDGLTVDQFERLWVLLVERDLDLGVYTTSSFGSKPGARVRLFVRLDREQTADEVHAARKGFGAMFGPLVGADPKALVDPQASSKNNLFYGPRCPAERMHLAFHRTSFGGKTLSVDELVACAPVKQAVVHVLSDIALQQDPAQSRQAERDLLSLADRIADCRTGLRSFTEQASFTIGHFVAAGLLDEGYVLSVLDEAVETQNERHGDSRLSLDDRKQEIRHGLSQGIEAGPKWPLAPSKGNPTALEERKVLGGRAYLEAALAAEVPERTYSAEAARQELLGLLRTHRPIGVPWVDAVWISTGAGKTWCARQVAAERAQTQRLTVIASNNHRFLRQVATDLEAAGVKVFHRYSASQPTSQTGGPQCLRLEEKLVKSLLKSKGNLAVTMCPTCSKKDNCEAKNNSSRRAPADAFVILTPYASLVHTVENIDNGDWLLIGDEEPPTPENLSFTDDQVRQLQASHVLLSLKAHQRTRLQKLIEAHLSRTEPDEDTVTTLTGHRGMFHYEPGYNAETAAKRTQLMDVASVLLRAAPFWSSRYEAGGAWRVRAPHSSWSVFRECGGTVMTATPNVVLYSELSESGVDIKTHKLFVDDYHKGTPRVLLYTSTASRSRIMPGGIIDWKQVSADLRRVARSVDRGLSVFISTYKAIADALNSTHRHLLPVDRLVSVSYPQANVGMDLWKGFDVAVTMYDSKTPPTVKPDGTICWDESRHMARMSSAQDQGRLRDAQPREYPAIHIHVGSEAPYGWHTNNCNVVYLRMSNAPGELEAELGDALRALRLLIGMKALCEELQVCERTVRAWLSGKNTPHDEKMSTILARVRQIKKERGIA